MHGPCRIAFERGCNGRGHAWWCTESLLDHCRFLMKLSQMKILNWERVQQVNLGTSSDRNISLAVKYCTNSYTRVELITLIHIHMRPLIQNRFNYLNNILLHTHANSLWGMYILCFSGISNSTSNSADLRLPNMLFDVFWCLHLNELYLGYCSRFSLLNWFTV